MVLIKSKPIGNNMGNNYSVATDLSTTNTKVDDVKTVVDAIRATDVVNILADTNPLKQLLDQKAVAKYAYLRSNSVSYVDVVNITDKGVLTGITQWLDRTTAHNGTIGYIKIIIDGTTIFDGYFTEYIPAAIPGQACGSKGGTMSFNHRFNTSLRVQFKRDAQSYYWVTGIAYTID